jgi:hypothetical protein
MLGYALRCVRERPALWVPALILALLAAIPGALVATLLAPSATALLLTGDASVARALLPRSVDAAPWAAAAAVAVAFVWIRLVNLLVWCSDDRKPATLADAWRGTRRLWWKAFVLYAEAQMAVVAVILLLLSIALFAAPAQIAALVTFAAVAIAIAARAVVRVALNLALRAAVLDGATHGESWRAARRVLGARKHEAVAGWIALVAAGVALWIGGRLVTPVLQDTALEYGHESTATVFREAAHVVFTLPIEAFLVALSAGVWTAVHLGGDALKERPRERAAADPWLRRALMVLVVLVLLGNGIPTVIERRVEQARRDARDAVAEEEIRPEDVRRADAPRGAAADYVVTANLDGNRLEWATTIRWRNRTGERVGDVGIHVYPNAFTRAVEDIPLAREVLQSPAVRRQAQAGSFEITRVAVSERTVTDFSLTGTALTVPLEDPLAAGETVELDLSLAADLPRWPERYGSWDDVTLLGNWIPTVALRYDGRWRFDEYGAVGDPFVSDVASYDVSLSLERHLGAVGTGTLADVVDNGDRRTWRFSAENMRDAAFAISGVWHGLERRAGNTIVRAWFPADDPLTGAQLIDAAASAVDTYTRWFGELPFDEVEVVQTPGIFGGMEYPGVVFVSNASAALEEFPLLPDLLEHAGFVDAGRRYVVGHEVAHQWWYASVGNDQVREPWLDEALAELSTRLWLRAREGSDETWLTTNLATPPVPERGVVSAEISEFEDNATYAEAVYLQGSEILLRVKDEIGTARLIDVLGSWHRRAGGRIGTIDEFIATVRDIAGPGAAATIERFR